MLVTKGKVKLQFIHRLRRLVRLSVAYAVLVLVLVFKDFGNSVYRITFSKIKKIYIYNKLAGEPRVLLISTRRDLLDFPWQP